MTNIYYKCGRCGADMILAKAKYDFICACEKRYVKYRDFDEKRCKNYITTKDMDVIKAHINFCVQNKILEEGYKITLSNVDITVGEIDGDDVTVFVDDARR